MRRPDGSSNFGDVPWDGTRANVGNRHLGVFRQPLAVDHVPEHSAKVGVGYRKLKRSSLTLEAGFGDLDSIRQGVVRFVNRQHEAIDQRRPGCDQLTHRLGCRSGQQRLNMPPPIREVRVLLYEGCSCCLQALTEFVGHLCGHREQSEGLWVPMATEVFDDG